MRNRSACGSAGFSPCCARSWAIKSITSLVHLNVWRSCKAWILRLLIRNQKLEILYIIKRHGWKSSRLGRRYLRLVKHSCNPCLVPAKMHRKCIGTKEMHRKVLENQSRPQLGREQMLHEKWKARVETPWLLQILHGACSLQPQIWRAGSKPPTTVVPDPNEHPNSIQNRLP